MATTTEFQFSAEAEPHKSRTKAILQEHPEVRDLIGTNPWSAIIILAVVSMQLSLAWGLRHQSWWLVAGVAYLVGAFANHAMYVMIHEAAHNSIFRKRSWNYLAGIVADIPNVVPAAISFRSYHLKHHAFQGVPELDADIPNKWEAQLIGNGAIGKAIWLLFFPVFQVTRPARLKEVQFMSGWVLLNWAVVFGSDFLVAWMWGPKALMYLVFSFFFSIGLHPLGARWIQEHYLVATPQETYSYYGPLNTVAFNVGYHNEHHDFASIPWNNLPRLKQAAPEYYENIKSHTSWTLLLFKWIFDRELSLFSRMIRRERAGVSVAEQI